VPGSSLTDVASGTRERLQAIDVGDGVALWASGVAGTVVRSIDGGASWSVVAVSAAQPAAQPGTEGLELRDVEAFGAQRAFALAAGPGDRSRIFETTDGGATWVERWRNEQPEAFYDCFDFWRDGRGLAYSDSVAGRFWLAVTDDGASWSAGAFGPRALEGEGGFAASGTCLIVGDGGRAWIGTGGGGRARVLASTDFGASWEVFDAPVSSPISGPVSSVLAGAETAGILSLALDDGGALWAFGGRVRAPDIGDAASRGARIARSGDGGRSWTLSAAEPSFTGAVYGGAARSMDDRAELVAVGPGGAAYSPDAGVTWVAIDGRSWWSVAWTPAGEAWLAGPEGRLARWRPAPS
jgi:photosystem II stability/assembly factor-like uncharacterized protein